MFGDLVNLDYGVGSDDGFDWGSLFGNTGQYTSTIPDVPEPQSTSFSMPEITGSRGGPYGAYTPAANATQQPQAPTSAGANNTSFLGNLLARTGMSPENQQLVGQLAPLLLGGGTAALTSFLGGQAGSAAARGINRETQRIAAPTAQEQAVQNLGMQNLSTMTPQSRTPQAVLGDLQTTIGPMLAEILNRDQQQKRLMTGRLLDSGMAMGGVLPQQENYMTADTNRAILHMISQMVSGERQLRTNEATQMQNIVGGQIGQNQAQRQRTLMGGQENAMRAAQTAGSAPANAATMAALLAAIFGNQGGGQARA